MADSSTYPSHQRRTTICAFQPTACDVCIDCQNAFVEHGRAELRAEVERLTREREADTAIVAAAEKWFGKGEWEPYQHERRLFNAVRAKRDLESNGEGADDE